MEDPNFDFLKSKFHISKEAYVILQDLATFKKLKQITLNIIHLGTYIFNY